VLEIVLAIMLLAVDTATLNILNLMQAGALTAGHDAVSLGAALHIVDMLLATLKAIGFARRQAARGDTLIDTALLIDFALIDTRRIGLCESKYRKNKGKHCDGLGDFQVFLLMVRANSLDAIRR
jgi:hypothetical protein